MFRRVRPAVIGAVIASVLAVGGATADGGNRLLSASMTGIPTGGLTLLGVAGGGIPWVLEHGEARLSANGRLRVEVEGLVLASGGAAGTNPVPTGRAIVACNGGASIVMSDVVPFSPTGDAEVNAHVTLPMPCLAPVVFFAGQTGAGPRWFAVTGG
jgi:hypothetical protein